MLGGARLWPGVALGALLANADTGVSAATVLGITTGNTLEALVGRWLLVRLAGFDPSLRRVRDVLSLVALGAVLSTAVSATIGVASLVLFEADVAFADADTLWRTWWLGDMGGDLIVAPALLVAATHSRRERPPGGALEALALLAVIGGVAAFVFTRETALTYLVFPPLVWAALRFWQPGAAWASLLVAAIAVTLTADGQGPYAPSDPDERLLLAQTFTGVGGVSALLLATVTALRHRAERAVAQIASTLQESLMPTRLPQLPNVETATLFRAAAERQEVGGDFYDLFPSRGGWALAIGDVRGKGAEAAAMTALARYTLRAGALRERRPREVLGLLNEAMLAQHGGNDFCTAAFAVVEPAGTRPAVTLALGGHPRPLLVHADGSVEEIGESRVLIGLTGETSFTDTRVELAPGDCLVFYTDGLTDAHAPEVVVSPEELREIVSRAAGRSAAEVVELLERSVLGSAVREPRDDIAIVVLRLAPVPEAVSDLTVVRAAGGDSGSDG